MLVSKPQIDKVKIDHTTGRLSILIPLVINYEYRFMKGYKLVVHMSTFYGKKDKLIKYLEIKLKLV